MNPQERRRFPRLEIGRPAKVFRRATQQYTFARTLNVSAGGVLIEIKSQRPFTAGEQIEVGVAWTADPVMPTKALAQGTIIRADALAPGEQRLAIAFARRAPAAPVPSVI